jgi:drug/metabolite transporter (DMT)-like permease
MLYIFGFAALFLGGYSLVTGWMYGKAHDLLFLGDRWLGWGALVLLAFVPTIGGYGLYTVSLTYLPASVANLIATLEPSLTAVQAYIFLGERFTVPQLLGSLFIIAGVVMIRLYNGGGETASTQRAQPDTQGIKVFE